MPDNSDALDIEYDPRQLVTNIAVAYVSHNSLLAAEISKLINEVYAAIKALEGPSAEPVAEAPRPAVSVRKSITDEYLICLEDGKSSSR